MPKGIGKGINKEKILYWFGVFHLRVYQPGNQVSNSSLKRNIYIPGKPMFWIMNQIAQHHTGYIPKDLNITDIFKCQLTLTILWKIVQKILLQLLPWNINVNTPNVENAGKRSAITYVNIEWFIYHGNIWTTTQKPSLNLGDNLPNVDTKFTNSVKIEML